MGGASEVALHHDDLTGFDLSDRLAAERLECAGLGSDGMPARRKLAHRQGTESPRVTAGDDLGAGDDDQGVGALPLRHDVDESLFPGGAFRGCQHEGDDLGVGRRLESGPSFEKTLTQLIGVDQVAVVGDAERSVHRLDHIGLDVAVGVGAGGRVAGVADGHTAGERTQHVGVEDLVDQTLTLVQPDGPAVGDGDARGFLTTVLEGIEPEEGLAGRFLARARDTHHPALLFREIVIGVVDGTSGATHGIGAPRGWREFARSRAAARGRTFGR